MPPKLPTPNKTKSPITWKNLGVLAGLGVVSLGFMAYVKKEKDLGDLSRIYIDLPLLLFNDNN